METLFKPAEIIEENRRRNALLVDNYNPITGFGCHGDRVAVKLRWEEGVDEPIWLPRAMTLDARFRSIKSVVDYKRLRIHYDFEYWCAICVKVRHKLSGRLLPLYLNAPQRRVLATLEEMRLADKPLRMIMLKSRQWGGSTLVQMYFAWIQMELRRNWNSLICSHLKATSFVIRRMYQQMLISYPRELTDDDTVPRLAPVQGDSSSRELSGRGCLITTGSCVSQESARGFDCQLAHLSEVAFWKDTTLMSPVDFIRATTSGIPLEPLTAIVMESTANGVGDFFHQSWLRAQQGTSSYKPVFVPWYEIDMYRLKVDNPEQFVAQMNTFEKNLWQKGLTLEMIAWYREKSLEIGPEAMHAEYPTDDVEAFVNSGSNVFSSENVEELRLRCCPAVERGEVCGIAPTGAAALQKVKFVPDVEGNLEVWERPCAQLPKQADRYVVCVDVGGRVAASDYSVIAVFDRFAPDSFGIPSVVAQWRGHCDHDILGWKAAAIARWYHNALLIIESNSLESANDGHSRYILEELNGEYHNMYVRQIRDRVAGTAFETTIGFHTNRSTKARIIASLIAHVRDGAYVERDTEACNEMLVYEFDGASNYHAKKGYHDDILMTRAIALYVMESMSVNDMPSPDDCPCRHDTIY